MASGGARNRSGPQKDENSARSDQAKYSLTALPASYGGPIPEFPLPNPTDRELDLWLEKWQGPHGAAWSQPSEAWRIWDIGLWVRTAVRCEVEDASATLIANLHRLGDRVGLSTAGLAEMGWKVAVDQLAAKRSEKESTQRPPSTGSRGRTKIAKADG